MKKIVVFVAILIVVAAGFLLYHVGFDTTARFVRPDTRAPASVDPIIDELNAIATAPGTYRLLNVLPLMMPPIAFETNRHFDSILLMRRDRTKLIFDLIMGRVLQRKQTIPDIHLLNFNDWPVSEIAWITFSANVAAVSSSGLVAPPSPENLYSSAFSDARWVHRFSEEIKFDADGHPLSLYVVKLLEGKIKAFFVFANIIGSMATVTISLGTEAVPEPHSTTTNNIWKDMVENPLKNFARGISQQFQMIGDVFTGTVRGVTGTFFMSSDPSINPDQTMEILTKLKAQLQGEGVDPAIIGIIGDELF